MMRNSAISAHILGMLFILLGLISSCSSYINEEEQEQLVVEGWIKEGDYPVVLLTTSVAVSEDVKNVSDLSDHIINWGRVAISDGDKEVVLTGMYDESYYPAYKYTTANMKGESGKTYTIDVRYESYHATAQTTIPVTVPLQAIEQQRVEGKDTLWNLTAVFNDPPGQHYYCIFHKIGLEQQQAIQCNMGVFDDSSIDGDTSQYRIVKRPVYRPKTITDNYSSYFTEGSIICIELCTLDKNSFNLWYDYQNASALGDNFFVPYTKNVRSNINGAYGYWCGYGTSQLWCVVGE